MIASNIPLSAGKAFVVEYEAFNVYSDDGATIEYEVISGDTKGVKGKAACHWQEVKDGAYLISWQENDGATVIHYGDFNNGTSFVYFTSATLDCFKMSATLKSE